MKDKTKIYEMSSNELNDQYQVVILKHLEAEQASKLMRSGGDNKTQKSNWLNFEKAYPPKANEVEKVDFLSLMKASSKDNGRGKKTVDSKDDIKKAVESKYESIQFCIS